MTGRTIGCNGVRKHQKIEDHGQDLFERALALLGALRVGAHPRSSSGLAAVALPA